MEKQTIAPEQPDEATKAFLEVRDKLAGLTRAVDSMAGEWKALAIPDYSATLEKLTDKIGGAADQLSVLSDKPGLRLTPGALSDAIVRAGATVRADDHAALASAIKAFRDAEQKLNGMTASAKTADEQNNHLKWTSVICVAATILICAAIPGPIIRAMPSSWHLPERMAVKALGVDPWAAGQRLMMFGYPEHWEAVSRADHILRANEGAISECEKKARKSRKRTSCTIEITPDKPAA